PPGGTGYHGLTTRAIRRSLTWIELAGRWPASGTPGSGCLPGRRTPGKDLEHDELAELRAIGLEPEATWGRRRQLTIPYAPIRWRAAKDRDVAFRRSGDKRHRLRPVQLPSADHDGPPVRGVDHHDGRFAGIPTCLSGEIDRALAEAIGGCLQRRARQGGRAGRRTRRPVPVDGQVN